MYTITADQVNSVDALEAAFATTRLLPEWGDIPDDFKKGNVYTQIAECVMHGKPVPDRELQLMDGVEPEALMRCVSAHLKSFKPKQEHKIAGVGFMISKVCTIE